MVIFPSTWYPQLNPFPLDVAALVSNDFTRSQHHDVMIQRSHRLGEETLNRTCYQMWSALADRLGMDHDGSTSKLSTYRSFLTTGFGPSHSDRSRDSQGALNRGRSGSRVRGSQRGRSNSGSRDRNQRPGPSRRRSPDRDGPRYPPKRGRGMNRW